MDERFKVFLEWVEAREANTPTMVPDASNMAGAAKLTQKLNASLRMRTEVWTEAYSIVDNTPGKKGPEAWRRLVQRIEDERTGRQALTDDR